MLEAVAPSFRDITPSLALLAPEVSHNFLLFLNSPFLYQLLVASQIFHQVCVYFPVLNPSDFKVDPESVLTADYCPSSHCGLE